jgi:hypothetical protein
MKFFSRMKDGGPQSRVWGYWLMEIKGLCSIVLLRFEDGTREAYHSHAFNAVSWLLLGKLIEKLWREEVEIVYTPRWRPIWTPRSRFHKVRSVGRSWVISFRGPWHPTWKEAVNEEQFTLTHGRRRVA